MFQKMICLYLLLSNIIAYILYARDKKKAIKKQFRTSESLLLTVTLLGGGFGAYLAANQFHHKTKKWHFKLAWLFGVMIALLLAWCSLY